MFRPMSAAGDANPSMYVCESSSGLVELLNAILQSDGSTKFTSHSWQLPPLMIMQFDHTHDIEPPPVAEAVEENQSDADVEWCDDECDHVLTIWSDKAGCPPERFILPAGSLAGRKRKRSPSCSE